MAINAFEKCEKHPPANATSTSKAGNLAPGRLVKGPLDIDDIAKRSKSKKKSKNSPYLHNDRVQLLSRITEKRLFQRKDELFSSFPLATNIYKASSDEFKALKKNKQKTKKSVLTLPNYPAPIPQSCTVSDMNDSEYCKSKKRTPTHHRKQPVKFKGFEFFDRDAHMDISSTDLITKNYDGDGRKVSKYKQKGDKDDFNAQDVWAVLRNINKFQFKMSPHMSDEENISLPKKKTTCKRRTNIRNGRRLIETHRTEEIEYVANFEIQSKTSVSQSSSFDRVTVINKQEFPKNDSEKAIKTPILPKIGNKTRNLNKGIVPRHLAKPTQMREHYRPTLNRNQPTSQLNKVSSNAAIKSNETVRESVESNHYFRIGSDSSLNFVPNIKQMPHPQEIEQIINGNLGINSYRDKHNKATPNSPDLTSKGNTRMILNNDQGVSPKVTNNVQKRKPRLVTTMPSAATMPKLTATDIKRRLAHIKFPVVVLGKDQLSSSVEVMDYDPPQFSGLEHVWPFMVEWTKPEHKDRHGHSSNDRHESPIDSITNNLKEINNDISVIRASDKNGTSGVKKRVEHKQRFIQGDEILLNQRKPKPMRQFRDKMLKLLYIKPTTSGTKNKVEYSKDELKIMTTDAGTEPVSKVAPVESVTDIPTDNYSKNQIVVRFSKRPTAPNKLATEKHPWSRAKWASDFIDNVISKIKSGVYYSHEEKLHLKHITNANNLVRKLDIGTCFDFKDVSIQTFEDKKLDFEQNFSGSGLALAIQENTNSQITIPGFDDVLPELEIETLNINQVAVKHCLTNVMVHFDVAVPDKSSTPSLNISSASSRSSCVPLSMTESQMKIFKCNTTILNAVLPAELCSVIPNVIRNIFDSETRLFNPSSLGDSLMSISEISECESMRTVINLRCDVEQPIIPFQRHLGSDWVCPSDTDFMTSQCSSLLCSTVKPMASIDNPWITSWISTYNFPTNVIQNMSPRLQALTCGSYSLNAIAKKSKKGTQVLQKKVAGNLIRVWSDTVIILSKLCITDIMPIVVDPMKFLMSEADLSTALKTSEPIKCSSSLTECTALQPYQAVTPQNFSIYEGGLIPPTIDFTNLLQSMWGFCKFNIHLNVPYFANSLKLTQYNTIKLIRNENNTSVSVTVTKQINSLFDGPAKVNKFEKEISASNVGITNALPLKCIEYEGKSRNGKNGKRKPCAPAKKLHDKGHKKVYIKLYKKCKSTSNISSEKSSTSLSKIGNLDDFFQALGSAKMLSSVLDGCAGKKVLKCIGEMKHWITDITQRQALLVLLLSNKKDTPNLLKFRTIILQGIAVNRITRASELDMEIEVIERENLKLNQFEGISYLPASVTNKDNLMEELCWIAKTTASDYQRPFDESSEKLLKSLIEKRKKLNPSYLRVMARYVGLGLLKTSN